MSDDKKRDILFIAPWKTLTLHSKIIKTTLWAIESDVTYTVMSVEVFVDRYGLLSVSDATNKLTSEYENICNIGTLSKREKAEYSAISDPIFEYLKQEKQDRVSQETQKVFSVEARFAPITVRPEFTVDYDE